MAHTTASETRLRPGRASRIGAVDALRGFALCGILVTNLPGLLRMEVSSGLRQYHPIAEALELTAHQRFFPIFSLLFGISFAIFLNGATARSAHPRWLLVRRLLALGAIGAAHQVVHPGEALVPYAVIGLVVLLPATLLPTTAATTSLIATGGLLLLGGGIAVFGGGLVIIPGLFLIGLALARSGIVHSLDLHTRALAVTLVLSAPVAVAATWWQRDLMWSTQKLAETVAAAAGIITAVAYSCAVLLLVLRGPARRAVSAILEPLGRMALTNYLGATVLVLTVGPLLGLRDSASWGTALLLTVAILIGQAVFSAAWLSRFRFGPAEWVLRCITWWQIVPLTRAVDDPDVGRSLPHSVRAR